jgi:Asp-tRNA(Asn)/Glu-tRNA(Gln) amidotransferase A subunit family amidase
LVPCLLEYIGIDRGAGLSPGFEGIPAVTGPMGRNVQDLKLVMKLVLDADLTRFDATVIPAPWNESKFAEYATKKKLKFGYYFDDGVTISSPPVKRAIEETVKALEAQGHEVELVAPPNVIEAVRIFIALSSQESSLPPNSHFWFLWFG